MRNINFIFENEGFNFRVGAYITCKDKMLLQVSKGVNFHNLVGGRVQLGESTIDAIKREVKEELGIDIKNPRLMVVAEDFFKWEGKNAHELFFVFHVKLPQKYLKMFDNFKILDQTDTTMWVEKAKLKEWKCLPSLIYDLPKLEENPNITHIIGD